jgi:hypothetical protein
VFVRPLLVQPLRVVRCRSSLSATVGDEVHGKEERRHRESRKLETSSTTAKGAAAAPNGGAAKLEWPRAKRLLVSARRDGLMASFAVGFRAPLSTPPSTPPSKKAASKARAARCASL